MIIKQYPGYCYVDLLIQASKRQPFPFVNMLALVKHIRFQEDQCIIR